ncbi:SEC-C motif-containing protein [Actinocorallia herbida]|uniref:SEC-C motif-containing protein n=1 Tax=Actinocorallia herbida TaxID=58109 RepID=A0A3N1CQG6_9ACTN|nr:SEC-C metal-binding domain-containing protein [Actinocorallia herbida]ROO82958.1 SEC-C motif-containing protein [Actinocorallia herbida]
MGTAKGKAEALALEKDALKWPDQRAEILMEAARAWADAGESARALEIYDGLAASADEEDAQFARTARIELLAELGRPEEAEAELARLSAAGPLPGPATLAAEWLESQGRPAEALTWFNMACREVLALDEDALADVDVFSGFELVGRARVRAALGLPPDTADLAVSRNRARLNDRTDAPDADGRVLGSFFVGSDVAAAFAAGLVSGKAKDSPGSYFREVELGWRASAREAGVSKLTILPLRVDDLLSFAAATGRDPAEEATRREHLYEAAWTGTPLLTWPPGRNEPCWCGSGHKYKKCCGV